MNVFNRLVVVLLILLAILVIIVVVVVPKRSFDTTAIFFTWLAKNSSYYMQSKAEWPLFATARVVIGGLLLLGCLLILYFEFRRPRRKVIRAQKLTGGESFITVESIAQRLAYNIDQLPDVVGVTPRITGYGRQGLDLELLLETAPEVDVPMKTEEVLQVTKEVVTERMGLKLGKTQVKIKHAPYPKA
jgi:hypothetical protein